MGYNEIFVYRRVCLRITNSAVKCLEISMTKVRLLCVIVVAMCCFMPSTKLFAENLDTRLQGVWFGDGRHPMSRTVLIVDGEKFTIVSPLGAFVSRFTINDVPALNEIDIDRFDGQRQMGVFEISDTQLLLKLAEPNQVRPTLKDVRFPNGKPHWHSVFRRRPTQEGLEVLARHSDKLPEAQN